MSESLYCRLPGSKFIKKEAVAQVFSCKFCEVFKNAYFVKHLRPVAFGNNLG